VISLPCPTCGSELAFLEQYQRHYCYACGNYAPEGYGDRGAKICPTCRGILSYVAQYDRHYCYRCNAYPADGVVLQSLEDTMPVDVRPVDVPPVAEATEPTAVVTEPETKAEEVEAAKPTDVAPTPEPEKTEAPTTPTRPMSPAPIEASPQPEEIVEEELPPEETKEPGPRPPIVRLKVFQAKKPALMDLCKAYDLDATGTKEQLRERLLSYLDTLEAEAEPEPAAESEAPTGSAPIEQSEIEGESSHTPEEIAEVPAVEEEPESEPPASATPVEETPVVETHAAQEPTAERIETPLFVSIPQSQPVVSVAPVVEPMRALHPCPTCGRELTYIARYRRWYCYHCRAYAPVSESKFACPTCGAGLRWIAQYERWWCDSCRRYAPADLPRPESAAIVTAVVAATPAEVAKPLFYATASSTTVTHRHRSPGSGIGFVAFGVILFVLYEMLVDLPAALSYSTGIAVAPNLAFGLRFFAFVFVALGAIMGLSAVRDRR
jgi:predicted RNA-binding Zn-ribbon protein involved in translation (DUF1610 family)